MNPELDERTTVGAEIVRVAPGVRRLAIPAGPAGRYRLAQLDDDPGGPRRGLPWRPPARLALRARVSDPDHPGTWGFGWWNVPFSALIDLGVTGRRLPALPNAAWFFFAGSRNYLALREGNPPRGMLAATFAAPRIPPPLLLVGLPALPLLLWPRATRLLRRAARLVVRDVAARLEHDPTVWHDYAIEWRARRVNFFVDGAPCLTTTVVPNGPLCLVLWIDNQYAALPPSGKLDYGQLANPPAWLDLAEVKVGRVGGG